MELYVKLKHDTHICICFTSFVSFGICPSHSVDNFFIPVHFMLCSLYHLHTTTRFTKVARKTRMTLLRSNVSPLPIRHPRGVYRAMSYVKYHCCENWIIPMSYVLFIVCSFCWHQRVSSQIIRCMYRNSHVVSIPWL